MSQPETRTVTRGAWGTDLQQVMTQRAIPWCTTHDARYSMTDEGCDFIEDYRLYTGEDVGCQRSIGGPDHKQWEDI